MDELFRCSCNFINVCLSSDCSMISFVATQGIFYSRIASPLGRNTNFCCTRYGGRTQDLSFIRYNYINYRVTRRYSTDFRLIMSFDFCMMVHLLFKLLIVVPLSVIVWQWTLASCCRVPNQMNWVLSVFSFSRFDVIHSFISSMHDATWAINAWQDTAFEWQ